MDAVVLLCDSTICRLCAEENDNGTHLFPSEGDKENLSELINKYLPLKVEKDGKFPCTLCPGCTIQFEATKSFFDLIIEGQNKLRELFALQQETLRRREKEKEDFKNAFKTVNPSSSFYAVHTTDEVGDKYFIQVVTDGPLFSPEQEIALRIEGLEKPKKKRGRPPKPAVIDVPLLEPIIEEVKEVESDTEYDGKRKRRIKKPSRYSELIQGKELDKFFQEEGVLDEESTENDVKVFEIKTEDFADSSEIIGHMQSKEGERLEELYTNKASNKVRTKHKGDTGKRKEKHECEFCGRFFQHAGRLEVHKSFHKNIKYQCGGDECFLNFEAKPQLETHQKETSHTGIKLVECLENYGEVELPSQNQIKLQDNPEESTTEDALTIPEEKRIVCTPCNKTFSCKQNFEIHMKAIHENQKPYECEKCKKKFPYLNSLRCHMLQHTEKTYPCESCEKIFNHPSSLVYHREAEHNNGRKFVCNKCKKTFKHKQLLLRHQLVHTNERPHLCKLCGATFKTKANLMNHMTMHTGEKKYYCMQCGQSFAHKTSLTLHVRWHNGQKPYECDVCMKTFSQKGNLAEHRRTHTGEKPYACTYCGRRFTTSSQFKLHVKRHTGEKPWRCEFCAKTFLHKDTWKCHTRRHRNERPFQCQQCLRGFTEQWALRKHERLHTGERPYLCDICSKSFADSSNLTKHKKIHSKPEEKDDLADDLNDINIMNVEEEMGDQVDPSNQILYLTYQDGDSNEEQPQTLVHIVDTIDNSPSEVENVKMEAALFDDNILTGEEEEMSLDIQLQQLVDNDGNPINLTTADGQQIKVVSTIIDDEQCIQGLMSDGTLLPINLTMQDGKPVLAEVVKPEDNTKKIDTETELNDSQDLLQETIRLLADENKLQLNGGQKNMEGNKFHVYTEDNVCFLAPYEIDNSISNQYINIQ